MNQSETFQPETYFCQQCYIETKTTNPECPQCGIKMKTHSQMKSLGVLFAILGIILSLCLGLCVLLFLAVLLFGELPANKFSACAGMVACTSAGTAAGITLIIGGVWQAKHGRQSKIAIRIFFILLSLMVIIGSYLSATVKMS